MTTINAYKMDGLGNDFVIIDRRKISISITKEKISSNLFVKFSNIFITHSSNRTSGRTLAD